jgi:nitroimidazol reductase NimA-like FMN-containing flavoprotein (pyridoxamine 5'-phosphate oxidase superfamily)
MAGSLHALSREQCQVRLRAHSIGRIAITHQALPSIVPVNYVVMGGSVVFRTETDGMLARACQGNVVAFEVDDLAADGASGWSVMVVGVAEALTGSAALRAVEAGIVSAAGDGRDLFIGISVGQISGRAIEPALAAANTS